MVKGWQAGSGLDALDMALTFKAMGLRWLVFTDIARDGLQTGLNIAATAELARQTGMQVIASGGVGGWDDIHATCQAGLPGVIVGRALYEGKFNPTELFSYCCQEQ